VVGCGQTWRKPLGIRAAWKARTNLGVADGPADTAWDDEAAWDEAEAGTAARPATVRPAAAASAPAHRGSTTTGMDPPAGTRARAP
jgi:hypothetical protein